jgi:(p)ppGpp synthase/HD superfamily hydrolase
MSDLIARARRFADIAHATQKRKYTAQPYFTHVDAVARAIQASGGDEAMVAAAYLHDTLEDTATTYSELVAEFGTEVADLVKELTDVYTPLTHPGLNRKARKALEVQRLAKVSDRAKLIKRADMADNTSSIEQHDPKFARVYNAEKAELLKVL